MQKLDKRRKYYLVLDCETSTLPCASKYDEKGKQIIALARPLIYDLGWQVVDRKGVVYSQKSYLITEIFSVPEIFNTGYYASKREIYMEKLRTGDIVLTDWDSAIKELIEDMLVCESVGAYNSMFDFKKAIPFTEIYIRNLYSKNFYHWEELQIKKCEMLAKNEKAKIQGTNTKAFDKNHFHFRGNSYPLFDLWGLTCEHILNCDSYKKMCKENKWETGTGAYFKTSAETAYRFIKHNKDFEESHTALDDAIIESILLVEVMRKKVSNLQMGVSFFPFRTLGRVENFHED